MSFAAYSPKKMTNSSDPRTHEVVRLDADTLGSLVTRDPDTKQVLKTGKDAVMELLFKSVLPRVRVTAHLRQRIHSYVGKLSRCGSYVEMTAEEEKEVIDLIGRQFTRSLFFVVEVGFNKWGQVCKIAAVFRLCGRFCFMCFGMDGGIKTIYFTPEYKHRHSYQAKNGAVYQSKSQFLVWIKGPSHK